MKVRLKTACLLGSIILFCLLLGACRLADATDSVGVVGYNHTGTTIVQFLVSGGGGGSFIYAHQGGGAACCVSIPKKWNSGLTVEVEWTADLKSFKRESVSVPQYDARAGQMAVHFLRNGDVRVFVTSLGLGHPDYPLKGPEASLKDPGSFDFNGEPERRNDEP